jgi:hypothetical protein
MPNLLLRSLREGRHMEELLVQVGNVGFPIVLSMYLLVRLEGKMEQLASSILKLTAVLEERT